MRYIDYEYFVALYGYETVTEQQFNRLAWDAERAIDNYTTGVDGLRKLRVAFPTDEDDAEAVKRCVCKLVEVMVQIEQAQEQTKNASGFVTREDGTVVNKVVSSVSSGSESIHYATSNSNMTEIDLAVTDSSAKNRLFERIVRECLTGITDANGVNLLFGGPYPRYYL